MSRDDPSGGMAGRVFIRSRDPYRAAFLYLSPRRGERMAVREPSGLREVMAKPARAPENLLTVLPSEISAALFAAARPHRLKADQTLFTAGDPGDGCYRVEQGLLKVSVVSPSGSERILAILGPGSLVGEFAMLDAQPRSASVTAARDSELSFISHAAFEQVAAAHPHVYRD